MPIPKPRYGESTEQFMGRCMGSATMRSEYPDVRQRAAVCRTQVKTRMTDEHETNYLDTIAEIKAYGDDEDEDKGEFEGYASIFGNKDLGNDVVNMGAFKRSLRRRGAKGVKLLYQHDTKQPIGVFDRIKEDEKGLYVKGRLALGTQKGREVFELMKMGAIDGLSIGYKVDSKGYEYDQGGKRRRLKEVDLMEISAVTFPMNPQATISAVKSDGRTVREWEGFFRDEGDLSRSDAKMAAKAVSDALGRRDDESQADLIDAIKQVTNILEG